MSENFFDQHIPLTGKDSDDSNSIEISEEESVSIDDEPVESLPDDAMPEEASDALVRLLRKGAVIASKSPDVYAAINRHKSKIKQHLANMYLRLVIDDRTGVLFIASKETEEDKKSLSMITKRTLSLYDTLILLILRKHYQERETIGETKIVIDEETVLAKLIPFIPLTNSSTSDQKKLHASLGKFTDKQVITMMKGTGQRYEISPLIRYVASAEVLEGLLIEYLRIAKEAGIEEPVIKKIDTIEEQEKMEFPLKESFND